MTLIERYQKECQRARQKFKDTGSKYHEGYADAFDIAEQMYEEKRNAREWERMVDAYGTLEGWLCPCGFSSAGAWNYCPSCGSEMYGGEKHED